MPALLLRLTWSIRQRRKLQARCGICQIYEHDLIEMAAELQRAKAQTWGKQRTIVCQWAVTDGGQHESCLPANVRESLPKTIRVIGNVHSRRCGTTMEMYISAFKECTREETSIWQDQYALQRVPEVTSTGGRMVLGPLADSTCFWNSWGIDT